MSQATQRESLVKRSLKYRERMRIIDYLLHFPVINFSFISLFSTVFLFLMRYIQTVFPLVLKNLDDYELEVTF